MLDEETKIEYYTSLACKEVHPLNTAVAIVFMKKPCPINKISITEMARITGWSIDKDDVLAEAKEIANQRPTKPLGLIKHRNYEEGLQKFIYYKFP